MRHELHLAKRGLTVLAASALPIAAVCYLLGGRRAALSAAAGIGLMVLNHGLAAVSTGWARKITPAVALTGMGGFAFRLIFVFFALGAAAAIPALLYGYVATGLVAAMVITLAAECISYSRQTYVPAWRRRLSGQGLEGSR